MDYFNEKLKLLKCKNNYRLINNECVPKGSGTCTLDNDNKKCSFKSSHSNSRYLSNLKYALLLVLFFIF